MTETKNCKSCGLDFSVAPEDFAFYERIKVPPPTWCPRCRLRRRLAFLDMFGLYKRTCDLCKKEVIARYAPGTPYTVYCPRCWWSDKWDPMRYGRDYDFSRPFLAQFKELWETVPLISLSIDIPALETSPYTNHTGHLKNCYLIFHGDSTEDSAYGFYHLRNKRSFDCSLVGSSELCFDSIHCFKNYRCVGVDHTTESVECIFTRDVTGSQNCFGSANLRGKQYQWFNEPLSKEEYARRLKECDLGSWKNYREMKQKAEAHCAAFPRKALHDKFAVNSTGNYIFDSKNIKECFETSWAEDSKFLFLMADAPIRDCYDVTSWGDNITLSYECCNIGEDVTEVRFSEESGLTLSDAEYCKASIGGAHHFGCVSVKKGEYCVLNKKYTKEAYEALVPRIRKHMDEMPYVDKAGRTYRYGEFFPPEFSPIAYNDSFAQIFFPKTREEAANEGLWWQEPEVRTYQVTLAAADLPDHIKEASDKILEETVGCAACGKGFKIIPDELAFLKAMNLPLPRECPMCRIMAKMRQWVRNLNGLELVTRRCERCNADFPTTYTEEWAPRVLCNKCYLEEVV